MLRRVLPVVAGAAAVLLVPSAASATPPQAPVDNIVSGWGLTAHAERVPLADGRTASATLWRYSPGAGAPAIGHLSIQLWTDHPCLEYVWPEPDSGLDGEYVQGTCQGGWVYGSAELTGDQVQFDRDLRTASVDVVLEVPVSDWTPPGEDDGGGEWTDPGEGEWTDPGEGEWTDPGEGEWTDPGEEFPPLEMEEISVSLAFTGSAAPSTYATHGTVCGDGERECQSVRIYAARDGSVTGTIDGAAALEAPARLDAVKGLDLAAPKFLYPL